MAMATISVEGLEIPADATTTLEGFRRWYADLDEPRVRASFIAGNFYVEMSPQNYRTHAPVATAILVRLGSLAQDSGTGVFFAPPSWITCDAAGLSTEPDGFFARYETLQAGLLRLHPQRAHEMVGRPDMALEVVSASSVTKDLRTLRERYARAGVGEYWLVDARADDPRFDLLILGEDGRYRAVAPDAGGFRTSPTFARAFRLRRLINPAGLPEFRLDARG